jgi:uncharacterized coiled-coil protein SlyX
MLSHEKAEQSERERAQRDALIDVDDMVLEQQMAVEADEMSNMHDQVFEDPGDVDRKWGAYTRDGRVVNCDTQHDAELVRAEMERTERAEDHLIAVTDESQAMREAQAAEWEGRVECLEDAIAKLQNHRDILRDDLDRLAERFQARTQQMHELSAERMVWRERYFQVTLVLADLAREYEEVGP